MIDAPMSGFLATFRLRNDALARPLSKIETANA